MIRRLLKQVCRISLVTLFLLTADSYVFACVPGSMVELGPTVKKMDLSAQVADCWNTNSLPAELRIKLKSQFKDTVEYLLLPGAWDSLHVILVHGNGMRKEWVSGHFVADSRKPEKSWIFYEKSVNLRLGFQNQFPLMLAPMEEVELILQGYQVSDLKQSPKLELLPLQLSFDTHGTKRMGFQFLFLGIILVLFVYHLVLFMANGESYFLLYASYMACLIINTLDYCGLTSEWIAQEDLFWRPYLKNLADNGIVITYLLLLRELVRPRQFSGIYEVGLRVLIMAIFLYLLGTMIFLGISMQVMKIFVLSAVINLPAIVFVLLLALPVYKGEDRASKYFITGSLILILGTLLNGILFVREVEATNIWGFFDRIQFFQISTLLELILFTTAVGIRTRENLREQDRIKDIDQFKSRLFSYMYERTRSPLTMILGPTKSLLKQLQSPVTPLKEDLLYYVRSIHRNADFLSRGIGELTELAGAEEQKMRLQVQKVILDEFVREKFVFIKTNAREQGLTFHLENQAPEIEVFLDTAKINQIFSTLSALVFQYAGENGDIRIRIWEEEAHVYIQVWYSGVGIAESDLPYVFEQFIHPSGTQDKFASEYGIRLALAQKFAQSHGGDLQVESEFRKFTAFTLTLPLGNKHLKEEEILKADTLGTDEMVVDETAKFDETLPFLLVVEEDAEVRKYIMREHANSYQIYEASDSLSAAQLASEHLPDLIITGLSLPGKTGLDLAQSLKSQESTSHIPIILLSAKPDSQLDSIYSGVDAFLPKPFDPEVLIATGKNLIDLRIKLRESYLNQLREYSNGSKKEKEILTDKSGDSVSDLDRTFIEKVRESLDQNYQDPNFNVEKLAENTHYQRRQLHRKVNAIFDCSPKELIKTHRMLTAEDLLKDQSLKIYHIAEMVGYRDAAGFSKAFREHSGMTPKEYRKQQ